MAENKVEAVDRALSILDAFHEGADELSLAALARATGLYKSTILRLLATLEGRGYVLRTQAGRYRLGAAVWRLGSLYRSAYELGEHIRPELRRLVEATSESASFYVREGVSRVCLYRLNSPRAARHHLEEGTRLSLTGGASSRVLIAWTGPEEPEVRAQGHAVSRGERDPDVAAVAVPVFDQSGGFRGALSVSGLITRMDDAAMAKAITVLKDGAARLAGTLPG